MTEEERKMELRLDSDHYGTYYDRQGRQITLMEWARLAEQSDYKRVDETLIDALDGKNIRVSTIWLGINHNFGGHGNPIIFETMVFGDIDLDQEQWRYHTEEEAIAGHQYVCTLVRTAVDVWPHGADQ